MTCLERRLLNLFRWADPTISDAPLTDPERSLFAVLKLANADMAATPSVSFEEMLKADLSLIASTLRESLAQLESDPHQCSR
jgi:hypothetical protein